MLDDESNQDPSGIFFGGPDRGVLNQNKGHVQKFRNVQDPPTCVTQYSDATSIPIPSLPCVIGAFGVPREAGAPSWQGASL